MQRLIVEVCQGQLKGRKVVIAPGEVLRVGRGERARLVVPHDDKLSGVHFQLAWDGSVCKLSDRNSKSGTLLDGEPAVEAEVVHGAWIRAGETDFSVYFEHQTPARRMRPNTPGYRPDTPERAAARQQALDLLQAAAKEGRLFAVLDTSRDLRILELVRESVESYRSLYDGVQGEKMAQVAPHLVELPDGSRLLELLVREGWGKRWGIYLTSDRPLDEVRRQLRRFLIVEVEGRPQRAYFRYYDPWVFQVFWQSATVRQRHEFMAQSKTMIFESGRHGVPMQVQITAPVTPQLDG